MSKPSTLVSEPQSPDKSTAVGSPTGRLLSLDAFRGLTVAGMILVNNSAPGGEPYPPLRHAAWHGFTPTDLVFPSFLFIAGVAIPLAIGKRRDRGDTTSQIAGKVVWRSLVIVGLGLALAAYPYHDVNWSTLRLPGVLQRIGLCYLAAALIFMTTRTRAQVAILVGLLLGYWAALRFIPVPGGVGAGDLSRENGLPSYVDRLVMAGHLYKKDYDPEGLLSTLPAIATTLLGVLTGRWLSTAGRSMAARVAGIFAAGALLTYGGWVWGQWFPINKPIWTSSYVLFAGGLSLTILGLCAWLIEVEGVKRWAWPFLAFGSNPILVFFGSGLLGRVLSEDYARIATAGGSRVTVFAWVYQHAFSPYFAPHFASLLFSLTYVLFWFLIVAVLYRFRLSIRV